MAPRGSTRHDSSVANGAIAEAVSSTRFIGCEHDHAAAAGRTERFHANRTGGTCGVLECVDACGGDAGMQTTLMTPMFVHQRGERVHRSIVQRVAHLTGQLRHTVECGEHSRHTIAVGIEHGRDGGTGNARLASIGEQALPFQLRRRGGRQRNALDPRVGFKRECERAAVRRRIVVLSPPGDAEFVDFHGAAPLGKLRCIGRGMRESVRVQRGRERDARR
jgi:hypothetical protein